MKDSIKKVYSLISGCIIGILGGLIGLGGAEFRIPVLKKLFALPVSTIVRVNLSISLAETAGTSSVLISLPAVLAGLIKNRSFKVITKETTLDIIVPMGIGSIIGAFVGSYLMTLISSGLVKLILGFILIYSSVKMVKKL